MLLLAVSGLLEALASIVPRCVVRGLQMGLGLNLAQLALRDYVPAHETTGYVVAAAGFCVMLALAGNRRLPAGLVLIALGFAYAFIFRIDTNKFIENIGLTRPHRASFGWSDMLIGLQILVLPQLTLSLGNSVIATSQTVSDLFPDRTIGVRRIGITYGIMNLLAPWV